MWLVSMIELVSRERACRRPSVGSHQKSGFLLHQAMFAGLPRKDAISTNSKSPASGLEIIQINGERRLSGSSHQAGSDRRGNCAAQQQSGGAAAPLTYCSLIAPTPARRERLFVDVRPPPCADRVL